MDDPTQKQVRWWRIVGVVHSVRHDTSMTEGSKGQVYVPHTLIPIRDMKFAVRTSGDPNSVVNAVRAQISQLDPEQPIQHVSTMDKLLDESLAQPRFNTVLLGIFGGLALLLAAIGIYGVLSYSVSQRTHEIGVRMALGAQQTDVVAMVMKHAMRLAAIGIAIGISAAMLATRALSAMLFRVSRTDPTTYFVIVAILGAVALLASYAPARRATKVDPMIALRSE
jgi:putative ABC transport system permease protein